MRRRAFLDSCSVVLGGALLRAAQGPSSEQQHTSNDPTRGPDPWSKGELLEPDQLAHWLAQSSKDHPVVISVVFPVLYRQRHIAGAVLAGPGSKPDGLEQLKNQAAKLSKEQAVVIYCGCCPMERCPNIRPAFALLRDAGFVHVRVLNLPTNFRSNWVDKGYPVEPAANGA